MDKELKKMIRQYEWALIKLCLKSMLLITLLALSIVPFALMFEIQNKDFINLACLSSAILVYVTYFYPNIKDETENFKAKANEYLKTKELKNEDQEK